MGYYELSVTWDGAVDEYEDFDYGDEASMEAFVTSVGESADEHGGFVAIWRVDHDHDYFTGDDGFGGECMCSAYSVQFNPYWTFGPSPY